MRNGASSLRLFTLPLRPLTASPRPLWLAALVVAALLCLSPVLVSDLPGWLLRPLPGWEFDFADPINRFVTWLARSASVGPLEVNEITRGIGSLFEWPLGFVQGILVKGFDLNLPGLGRTEIAAVPWWALTAAAVIFGQWAAGPRAAFLVLGTCLYLLVLDLWEPAMLTLAAVGVAVVLGAVAGLLLGSWAYRRRRVEAGLNLVYDVMQTLPVFSYLVPILLFFGFGPVAALIATVTYAMPPMARNTTLALRRAPRSVGEFASVAGCTERQRLWLVLLPAARHGLLTGLNQVVMLSLSAVIIASIIGAGGLGNDVLQGLKSMQLGRAFEAGLAITLLAIVLDRLSRAVALRRPRHGAPTSSSRWNPAIQGALAVLIASFVLGQAVPALRVFPEALTGSTGRLLNDAVAWANVTFEGPIALIRDGMIRHVFRPVRETLLAAPWIGVVLLTAALAGLARGAGLALACVAMLSFIALTGYWDMAMVSLYLVAVSTVVALLIGIPVGLAAARGPRLDRAVTLGIDTLQTLPSFVYLIPVVMLFGLGDFPAMVAIVLYAMPAAVRYTKDGLARVPPSIIEAAEMSGCTPRQKLLLAQFPFALPEIMLGISQTVLLAFGMLVITALVGTRGLEQETLVALSRAKVGDGLVAGFGISFLSIIADRLIVHGSARLRQRLGQP